jgi:hypothetical protein
MRSQALVFDSSLVITGVVLAGLVAGRRVARAPACPAARRLAVAGRA